MPGAYGELWGQSWQYGKETVFGTDVAATRIAYFRPGSNLDRQHDPRPQKFSTGGRDNVRAFTIGPQMAAGSVVLPMSYDELVELALITLKADITPSTVDTSARLWTFPLGTALNSATVEWNDGANTWNANGVYGNRLHIAGNANGENIVTCDLFAKQVVSGAMTGSLSSRVPTFIEGWETKLYADAYGGTAGSTNVAGQLVNWDVTVENNLDRLFTADNANVLSAVSIGEIAVDATLTFLAYGAQVDTEFTNWTAATKRLLRLEFGQNTLVGATTAKGFVTLDIPGAWTAYPLGGEHNGVRAYELKFTYVYDITNAYGFQMRIQNARAAAW